MNNAINTMKAWIKRRRDKGEQPNADAIWNRINYNWPQFSEAEREAIFQGCN